MPLISHTINVLMGIPSAVGYGFFWNNTMYIHVFLKLLVQSVEQAGGH